MSRSRLSSCIRLPSKLAAVHVVLVHSALTHATLHSHVQGLSLLHVSHQQACFHCVDHPGAYAGHPAAHALSLPSMQIQLQRLLLLLLTICAVYTLRFNHTHAASLPVKLATTCCMAFCCISLQGSSAMQDLDYSMGSRIPAHSPTPLLPELSRLLLFWVGGYHLYSLVHDGYGSA